MKHGITIICLTLLIGLLITLNVDATKKVTNEKYHQYTVAIDAGHGGFDGGAVGPNQLQEKDINLAVALYLRQHLESVGINVVLLRDSDIDFTGGVSKYKNRTDISKRVHLINDSNADLYVSIHMNAIPDSRWSGAQTFYYPNNVNNKILAEKVQQNFKDALNNTTRKAKSVKTLMLLRHVEVTGILVEGGFLSNPTEAHLLSQSSYQDKLAYSIFLGILDYLETNHSNSNQ
jgi:N-acetylmuramoyl-L-alanine amidase